jgi:hypothetical protein
LSHLRGRFRGNLNIRWTTIGAISLLMLGFELTTPRNGSTEPRKWGIFVFDISDVLFAAVLILLNGVISGAGQDLWEWIRKEAQRRRRK